MRCNPIGWVDPFGLQVQYASDPYHNSDPTAYGSSGGYVPRFPPGHVEPKKTGDIWLDVVSGALSGGEMQDVLEFGHMALDVAGAIPVIGEPFDFVNGVIYALEGEYVFASLSFAGMLPVFGTPISLGKHLKFAKLSDEVLEAAVMRYPKKQGKKEWHHVDPLYMGGDSLGMQIELDAAYHQLITNEFRQLHPYGLETLSEAERIKIMKKVYEKYPLPEGAPVRHLKAEGVT